LIYIAIAIQQSVQNFGLLVTDQCVSGLTGLLVSIIFLSDPAVVSSAAEFKEYLHCRYVDEYQEPTVQVIEKGAMRHRRKSVRMIAIRTRRSTQLSQESVIVDKAIDYSHPKLAKVLNWVLIHIFRFKQRPRRPRHPSTFSFIPEDLLARSRPQSSLFQTSDVPRSHLLQGEQTEGAITIPGETDIAVPQMALTGIDVYEIENYRFVNRDTPIDNESLEQYFPTHALHEIHSYPESSASEEPSSSITSSKGEYNETLGVSLV